MAATVEGSYTFNKSPPLLLLQGAGAGGTILVEQQTHFRPIDLLGIDSGANLRISHLRARYGWLAARFFSRTTGPRVIVHLPRHDAGPSSEDHFAPVPE